MGFKCVPQATGLTVGDPKPNRKTGRPPRHRHNGFGWCLECMEERATVSKTVDRTLTHTNDYHGGPRSARAFWNAFEEELATEHQTVIHRKDGTTVTRAFRKDGVPLAGVIINPPDEVWRTWDEDTRTRFVDDSMAVMEEFEPRLFSRSHVRAHVTHNDEGGDHHLLYDTFDDDGRCNGNLLDAQLLHRLCEEYPAAMRERGWDLEDLDVTDWERMKTDEEYAAERRQKLKDGRLNTNEYARRKNEEAAQAAVEARIAAEEAARDALQRQLAATQAAQRVREEADIAIEAAQEAARADMEHAALMIELAAEQDAQALRDAILDDAEADADSIREDARADADAERRRVRRDVDDAARQVEMARREADTIVKTAHEDAEAILAHADERATDIVSDARQKAVNVTADAFVAISEVRAKVEEREQAAETREQEAREAREAYKAAETAYRDATPTVAGISPEEFAERLMGRLVTEATPRRNPMTHMANFADDAAPQPQQPEILGDRQTFNALKVVRGFINRVLGGIRQVAISVAREISREQARTQAPDKHAVARAKQDEKDFYASLVGSKTEMGGVSHGRGDSQMSR